MLWSTIILTNPNISSGHLSETQAWTTFCYCLVVKTAELHHKPPRPKTTNSLNFRIVKDFLHRRKSFSQITVFTALTILTVWCSTALHYYAIHPNWTNFQKSWTDLKTQCFTTEYCGTAETALAFEFQPIRTSCKYLMPVRLENGNSVKALKLHQNVRSFCSKFTDSHHDWFVMVLLIPFTCAQVC